MSSNPNNQPWIITIVLALISAITAITVARINNSSNQPTPTPTSSNQPTPTPTPTNQPTVSPNVPIIYLIDNSGSMGKCSILDNQGKCVKDAEKPYKVDNAKSAVLQKIDPQLSGADLIDRKIGLVEFGNWQDYGDPNIKNLQGEAKSILQCRAVETRVEPELNNRDKIKQELEKIKPNDDGVTPIAYAINYVLKNVLDVDIDNINVSAQIVLITDGEPNCDNEGQMGLCGTISVLKASTVALEPWFVDIIGHKIKTKKEENEFEQCAKKHPKFVTYHGNMTTRDELFNKLDCVSSYPGQCKPF